MFCRDHVRYLWYDENLERIRFIMHHGCANLCQCSSAWLEHSPCKRKVEGSKPSIGLKIIFDLTLFVHGLDEPYLSDTSMFGFYIITNNT